MKNIKFSIIVPVYNVESYLNNCLESLIKQTYKNIEILLIDDGSSDQSPKICDEFSERYENIIVFHKENGGLSEARNYGLKKASGDYILFVDSDDYISEDTCYNFLQILKNSEADIVTGNCVRVENNKQTYELFDQTVKINDGQEFIKSQLLNKTFHVAAWRNVYKRVFLLTNNLYFKKGIYHEDEQWTPRVFLSAERVINTDIVFYYHIIREGSITQQKNQRKNGLDLIFIYKDLKSTYSKLEDPFLQKLLYDSLIQIYLAGIYKTKTSVKVEKDDIEFLKKFVLSKGNKFKVILLSLNKKLFYYYQFSRITFSKNKFRKSN